MGINYKSAVIIGVKYEDLVKVEYDVIEEKKFNENTGEPYIKKTTHRYETFLGKRIDRNKYTESPTYQIEQMGLCIFDPDNNYYVGLSLSYLDENETEMKSIPLEEIIPTYKKVEQALLDKGYNKNPEIIHTLYAY